MSTLTRDEALAVLERANWYVMHGGDYVREVMGEDLQPYQDTIIDSVANNTRTAVRSCHDVGKSFTASRLTGWYLPTHPDSIVVTTAPSKRQVENVIWREIRGMYSNSKFPLGGEDPLKTRWDITPNWFAIGMTARDSDKLQGFHSKSGDILIIVDEAAGVSEAIFEAIEALMTSGNARLLVIGNPTNITGKFFRMFKDPSVSKIHISCFDTGNFIANGIKNVHDLRNFDFTSMVMPYPYLLNPRWAYDKLFDWGEDSPMFQSRVLGNFPERDENTLIPLSWIEAATTDERRDIVKKGKVNYGHDIGRYGGDESPIVKRYGDWVCRTQVFSMEDTMLTAGRASDALRDERGDYYIDITGGLGAGPYDRLIELNQPTVYGLNMSSKSTQPDEFINVRAEIAWTVRQKFERGEIYIDPLEEDLIAQLSNIKYKINSNGKRQIESKDEIKKRTNGKSPDRADALFMSYATPQMAEYGANKQGIGTHNIWG